MGCQATSLPVSLVIRQHRRQETCTAFVMKATVLTVASLKSQQTFSHTS